MKQRTGSFGGKIRAAAGLLSLLPALAAVPAGASDGASPWECGGDSSCVGQLAGMLQHGGDYAPGAGNTVIDIPPPACVWAAVGNAQAGSRHVVGYYRGAPPPRTAPAQQYQSFMQAKQMLAAGETPPGEWYQFQGPAPGDTAARAGECAGAPMWFFAVPGEPLPGVELPPVTLSQLATATLWVPDAGRMYLNPASGTTDSNLPTFVRVTLGRRYQIAPGGVPYVTDTVDLGGNGATVWVEATLLQLAANDPAATLHTSGCGYLGSTEMVLQPQKVAGIGANGTADCGVTFRQPGTWQITATLIWKTCWVPEVVYGPPPAACTPVPGAELNPVTWARTVRVREIQALTGSG